MAEPEYRLYLLSDKICREDILRHAHTAITCVGFVRRHGCSGLLAGAEDVARHPRLGALLGLPGCCSGAVPRLTKVADIFFAMNSLAGRFEPVSLRQRPTRGNDHQKPARNAGEIEHAISAFAAEPDGGLLLTGHNPAHR
jgi:hypothetical protein